MQQIFNALVKNISLIVFLSLFMFCVIFLNNRSSYHQSKFGEILLTISGIVYKSQNSINQYFKLRKENEKLLQENKSLKEFMINALKTNPNQVNKILNFKLRPAKIIKNSSKSFRNYIIIDKGKKDSINLDMGVISSNGIVGITNSVSENYSSVISILNKDLKINAKFKKNNAFGSLNWNGLNPKILQLYDISNINQILLGDTIVTGGMSTYFPEGILIGSVNNFKKTKGSGYYYIDVELFNSVAQTMNVYIIENYNQHEIKSLENVKN
ncbi:MAG: rod shape-determining protein MreC [Flavobacteriaceae bacterium]|nr:rod shape-determining protein MreC [Flavobacteriaceae bacterium]|tara:strand:- start:11165 stop:11971 length:807 start_codon:yes stop_codon:yes gene_type:complete